MTARAIATVSPDGSTVTLRKGAWCHTFPAPDLPLKTVFYRGLCESPGPKGQTPVPRLNARFYLPTRSALERAARVLAVMQGGKAA